MYKKLFSETIIYGIGSILPRLIMFALNPFIIGKTSNTDFSIFGQLYAAVSFLNVILTFGFETAFFRFATEEGKYQKVLNTSFWFMVMSSTLFMVLLYVFLQPLAEIADYKDHPEYLLWFGWIAFFDTICVIPFAVLRFKNRPILYSVIRVFQNVFQAVLTIVLLYYVSESFMTDLGFDNTISYPFISNLIASILGVFLLFGVIRHVQFKFDKPLFKTMFLYGYPIMIAGLGYILNENFDKLVQRNLIDPASAGSYAACYKLATLMTLFVTAYRMGIEPFFFKVAKKGDAKQTYANILFFFSIICNIVILAILANLDWIKKIFITDSSYWSALDIVPIILIANLFFGIYYNLSTWYKVTDRTNIGTVISLIGGAITIILNLILLPKYGFMVSAWTTLIAYGVMMVISYIWGQKVYPIPYKVNKIMLYMIIAIALAWTNYFILDSNLIIGNLLLIVYISFIAFAERNTLKKLRK
ncbi:Membrane protein involved in the export of O-antigen and teichoic acid [Algoriella xinjiangensis]|uniref:Membrane protein involved in the export of O-antigen and teichoic acid n=1 Tax=Algoriella xinjiangensis TaxID=684065 RepID=A0A1I4ZCN7_9FLAO|nr:oligosaccharide flippase family protein [Algoriella xinjiangensis]SFN47968.1 Membrane protein involved in the export of O-antigen and teichoic acid [Algoriella xinjiangensis]VDH17494.1 Polysaccharide biosynthesis protein [Algoriella xinjiangensis]